MADEASPSIELVPSSSRPALSLQGLESILSFSNRCTTMIVGYGSKQGYASTRAVEEAVSKHVRATTLLYFGDEVSYERPTVGLAHLYAAHKTGADVYMVQISAAKDYPIPSFVRGVYWHDAWAEGPHKWGGFDGKTAYSNTAVWHGLFQRGIEFKAYALGGGPIAKQEVSLMQLLGIPVCAIDIAPARPA